MRASSYFSAVDSHTEGMPTRVITGGLGAVPGATMQERRLYFERNLDDLRLLLMREPRGHSAMSGAFLQPPTRPDADWGVLFVEVSGLLPMCGHGTIGVATVLVECGMVAVTEPETIIALDTPAGLVEASVDRPRRPRRARVAAQRARVRGRPRRRGRGRRIRDGPLRHGVRRQLLRARWPPTRSAWTRSRPAAQRLIDAGLAIASEINRSARPVHPLDAAIGGCKHVVFHAGGDDGAHARNATAIHPGWLDRSPCGTGTSARMAALHARGELAIGEEFVNESVIGSRFVGRLVQETSVGALPGVIPEVSGRAWITAMGQYLLDPTDPFPTGFAL